MLKKYPGTYTGHGNDRNGSHTENDMLKKKIKEIEPSLNKSTEYFGKKIHSSLLTDRIFLIPDL